MIFKTRLCASKRAGARTSSSCLVGESLDNFMCRVMSCCVYFYESQYEYWHSTCIFIEYIIFLWNHKTRMPHEISNFLVHNLIRVMLDLQSVKKCISFLAKLLQNQNPLWNTSPPWDNNIACPTGINFQNMVKVKVCNHHCQYKVLQCCHSQQYPRE